MFANFKKNILGLLGLGRSDEVDEDELRDSQTVQIEPDVRSRVRPDIKSHWLSAMADTIRVIGCRCAWCRRISDYAGEVEGRQSRRSSHPRVRPQGAHRSSMATMSEVMEVLYPPSYLNIPQTLDPEATPPAYESRPTMHSNSPEVLSPCILSREGREFEAPAPASCRLTPQGLITSSMVPPSYSLSDADTPSLNCAIPSSQSPGSGSQLPIADIDFEPPECSMDELPTYSRFDSSRPRIQPAPDVLGPYPHISILSTHLE